jgi:hypothetical protein
MVQAALVVVWAGYASHSWEWILAGKLKVVVHVLKLLEMILLQNDKSFEFMVMSSGTIKTVYNMLLFLKNVNDIIKLS